MNETHLTQIEARNRYAPAKTIPQEMSQPAPSVQQNQPSTKPSEMLRELAQTNLIRPALLLGSPQEYVQFWADSADKFNSLMVALAAVHQAHAVLCDEVIDDDARREQFITGCIRSAFDYGGDAAEKMIRWAVSDCLAAYNIIDRFVARDAADITKDQAAAGRYNWALRLLDPLLVCVLESTTFEVNQAIRDAVVQVPMAVAHDLLLQSAKDGAALRGVSSAIELEAIMAAWDEPGPLLLEYLQEREPSLITDQLSDLCRGHAKIDAVIDQINRRDTSDLRQTAPGVSTASSDDSVQAWAKALADDMSRLHD